MRNKALMLEKGAKFQWDLLEKSLNRNFGVTAVAYHIDGGRRTADPVGLVNDICRLIKQDPKSEDRICGDILSMMNHEARAKRKYVAEECAAGMYKIVVPIMIEGRIEGFVSICGRPFISSDRVYTQYIHSITGENKEKIDRLLQTLNPIHPRQIKAILLAIVNPGSAMIDRRLDMKIAGSA